MAVNKDNDELKAYFVPYNQQAAEFALQRAEKIVFAPAHPQRAGRGPSASVCRFCDHKPTCHLGDVMEKNCRTCSYVSPQQEGKWYCHRWSAEIPIDAQRVGCDHWNVIKD